MNAHLNESNTTKCTVEGHMNISHGLQCHVWYLAQQKLYQEGGGGFTRTKQKQMQGVQDPDLRAEGQVSTE